MFYSSDPQPSNHENYLAPSDKDKYSSIRVLDQTHKNIRRSLSETNILSKFSSQFKNEQRTDRGKASKQRPYSTIGVHRETLLTARDVNKSKSLKVNRSNKSTNTGDKSSDPFADILHTVKQSLDLAVAQSTFGDSKGSLGSVDLGSKATFTSRNANSANKPEVEHTLSPDEASPMPDIEPAFSDVNWPPAQGDVNSLPGKIETAVSDINWPAVEGDITPSNIEPTVSDPNWSAVKGDVIPLTSESRVSSPRYHALSEDELEEELREENEVRSRNDSVVLRHEIIRSYSMTENLAQKTSEDDGKIVALDETDSRKGYVQLRYDVSGVVWEDDFDESATLPDDKPSKDVNSVDESLYDMTTNDSTLAHNHNSLSKHVKNAPKSISQSFIHEHKNFSTAQDNASKRLTVDVGELRRQSESRCTPSRPKHISIAGSSVREIKFLRSPTSRVSTLFSTKLPEVRSPGSQKGKQTIEPGFVFFGDGLFDFTEERNEEAVAFSTVLGELRSKLCGKLELNLGYLLSPTVTQNSNSLAETLEEVLLSLQIFIKGQESPVLLFSVSSKTQISEVIAQVLETVWKREVNPNTIIDSAFTLKVCGFEEYLSSSKLLCEYEYVHQCVMARENIKLALLDSDEVPRTLARSQMDDIADCEPRIYSQFFDRPLDTSVSREGLSVLREAFEEELKRVLHDADSQNPRFQPGRLVQSVRAVCTTLGQIETKGIVNSVYSLKEMKGRYDEACQGSPRSVTVDLVELRNLLQDIYKHVYLLIELYCNTFNTDFGRIRISEKIINGSIEVTAMTDKFSVYIPAAYRIPPEWKEKFETYIVEGKIYYGGHLLSVPECTLLGEIRTNFFAQISWQCYMEFGIEIRKLPRESKLCLTLYGLSPPAKNGTLSPARTPLGWTAVQLFDFNGVLVTGSLLFGLWPNQAANPLGACTSNLIDKRSAILQVDFTRHLSDIVFPALKIPEAETDTSEVAPTEMFNKLLSKDMFEDLRPEDIHMIWQNRYIASQVNI